MRNAVSVNDRMPCDGIASAGMRPGIVAIEWNGESSDSTRRRAYPLVAESPAERDTDPVNSIGILHTKRYLDVCPLYGCRGWSTWHGPAATTETLPRRVPVAMSTLPSVGSPAKSPHMPSDVTPQLSFFDRFATRAASFVSRAC